MVLSAGQTPAHLGMIITAGKAGGAAQSTQDTSKWAGFFMALGHAKKRNHFQAGALSYVKIDSGAVQWQTTC